VCYRVSETGTIDEDRLARLIATLRRYEAAARSAGADRLEAVATQAFRVASNATAAVTRIQAETGWKVRIIPAEEETTLTVEGARPWIASGVGNIVADIGGASTELVAIDAAGVVTGATSVPIGSGLLFDDHIGHSPPPPGTIEAARDRASEVIDAARMLPESAECLLLPGGTGYFLRLLVESLDPSCEFTPECVPLLHEWLSTRHAIETMERIPVQLDRAQVLPASLAAVEALVLRINPHRLVAIPSGIRDGIARTLCRSR
jgi:exopolyphosphatase/pppGpp-phosphohydrolase